jgi:hypothetical protein
LRERTELKQIKVGISLNHGGIAGAENLGNLLFVQELVNLQRALLHFEAHALRDPEARDNTPLDLLAGLPGSFARSTILPPGLIEVETNRSRSTGAD